VGEPPAAGRVVLTGNWALEVHRLETALRRSGGGHLLVIDTEGRDVPTAATLGLLDGKRVYRALRDPDVLALAHPEQSDDPPRPAITGATTEQDAARLEFQSGSDQSPEISPSAVAEPTATPGDAGPQEHKDPEGVESTDSGEVTTAGPSSPPRRTLLVPAVLTDFVEPARIDRELGWMVCAGPSRVVQREAQLLGRDARRDDATLSLHERLEVGVSGASLLTVPALVPLVAFARMLTPFGILLIWLVYLLVAAAYPLPPRLPREVIGLVMGGVGGTMVLLFWQVGSGLSDPLAALNLMLAAVALGAWAVHAGFRPGQLLTLRQLRWSFGIILLATLGSLASITY
jgi:hypothetical protein